MKNNYFLISLVFAFFAFTQNVQSQMMDNGHWNPDSLIEVTVSGKVIVDDSMRYPMYYLDSDNNDIADYHLSFGPHWYTPDSSDATRPENGQQITIKGGSHIPHNDSIEVIIVYEIDGKFWRDPVAPTWNYMGGHHGQGHHGGQGFAFGWMHDSLKTVDVSGTVLTDTTMYYAQFYLDADLNSLPDYFLNFGPPWYEPESGAVRPLEGETVTINGGLMDNHDLPMLIVYQINDQVWRDSTSFGRHFGGGWMHRDMDSTRYFHSPFDTMDGVHVNPGWHGGQGHGHGGMMSDSLFCQILEIFPQNIPNSGEHHILAGYEVAMFNPDGSNNMRMGGMNGRHMNFNNNLDFRLHYNDIQLLGENMDENSLQAKYWDDNSSGWITIDNAVLNEIDNTLTFSSNEVSNYVILTGSQSVSSINDSKSMQIKGFVLKQNYPNPFNPETNIEFELQNSGSVNLSIYNVLGQKVVTLVNESMNNGVHTIKFKANNFPSGMYYYVLKSNGQQTVRKMTVMK